MISLPFFSGHERVYITPKLPPRELLSSATGHIGIVISETTTPSLDRKEHIPTGFVTSRFYIDGTERQFHAHLESFWVVSTKKVPKAFTEWLKQLENSLSDALHQADKLETAAYKLAQKQEAAHAEHMAAIFKASREFWLKWTGPGEPPEGATTAEPPKPKSK